MSLVQDAEPLQPRLSTLQSMRQSLVDLGVNPMVSLADQVLADEGQPMDSPMQDSHSKSGKSTGADIHTQERQSVSTMSKSGTQVCSKAQDCFGGCALRLFSAGLRISCWRWSAWVTILQHVADA